MRILLDTHVLLWLANEPEKVSEKALDAIKDLCNPKIVCGASLWETAIKMSLGKLRIDGGFAEFEKLIEKSGIEIMPIRSKHLKGLLALPLIHGDPFDRLIVATALAEKMAIVSADKLIAQYDVPLIW